MRKILITIVLLLLILPLVKAQVTNFLVNGEVLCLTNSTTSGEFELVNPLSVDFTYVSVREVKVLDRDGNQVQGISINLVDLIIKNWKAKESKTIRYFAKASSDVKPGDYTLYLFMWGFTQNKLYLLRAYVPLKVSDKPLIFHEATSFVKENPFSNVALTGSTLVVYSHVTNVASSPLNVTSEAYLEDSFGNIVVKSNRTITLLPGDNIVRFEIPIPLTLPDGKYELNYIIRYDRGSYEFSKEYLVEFGVSFKGVSIERTNVLEGEKNYVYLTISSDRNIPLNLTVRVYNDVNGFVYLNRSEVFINKGSSIVKVKLPTDYPGKNTLIATLEFGNRTIGEGSGWYLVVGYPRINSTVKDSMLQVLLDNPNGFSIKGKLEYRIEWEDGRIVKKSVDIEIPPGSEVITIKLEGVGKFKYNISLNVFGKEIRTGGTGEIERQKMGTFKTTTSKERTTTSSPKITHSKTQTLVEKHKERRSLLLIFLVVTILIVISAGILWYLKSPKRRRKRRKKPKRRSPLGG